MGPARYFATTVLVSSPLQNTKHVPPHMCPMDSVGAPRLVRHTTGGFGLERSCSSCSLACGPSVDRGADCSHPAAEAWLACHAGLPATKLRGTSGGRAELGRAGAVAE